MLKFISGDPQLTTYSLRHSFATNQVANIVNKRDPSKPLRHYLELDTSPFFENGKNAHPLKSLSISMGHKSLTTTLQTYTHCLELFDDYDHNSTDRINDDVFAFVLGKSKGAYQTHKSRLGSNHAVVSNHASKQNLKSLEEYTVKHSNVNELDLTELKLNTTSPLQLTDLLIIKSIQKEKTDINRYGDSEFNKIANSILTFQKKAMDLNVFELISNTNKRNLIRLLTWFDSNQSNITKLTKTKVNRKRILERTYLFMACVNFDTGKLVVTNENEVTSITSLLNLLKIDFNISQRLSSRRNIVDKKNKNLHLTHSNHAANASHTDPIRKTQGYEIRLSFNDSSMNRLTLLSLLAIIGIYTVLTS